MSRMLREAYVPLTHPGRPNRWTRAAILTRWPSAAVVAALFGSFSGAVRAAMMDGDAA